MTDRRMMPKRMRCGMIRVLGNRVGYLYMTGRRMVHSGMKSSMFLLSELNRRLWSLDNVRAIIKRVKRAHSK